ncbi:MAG: hypothetical protein R2942_19785 [Ignavibacteria bacterium]
MKTQPERYANGRLDFHENTIKKIKQDLRIENKLEKALDIACGTDSQQMHFF